MIGGFLCLAVLIVCFLAGRWGLGQGLAAVTAVGYLFGITRAHIEGTPSYFLFDFALLGLYLAQLGTLAFDPAPERVRQLRVWLAALMLWPLLLLFVPSQPFLVQAVGFRCAVFFLPCVLLGARMTSEDLDWLACSLAVLNVVALAFGTGEFLFGLERFMPENAVTAIIYATNDVGEERLHRIPATFYTAHAYGGTMVATIPFLFGYWFRRAKSGSLAWLPLVGIGAALLGVFLSAARMHFIYLVCVMVVALFGVKLRWQHRFGLAAAACIVALVVAATPRLQRFSSLQDAEAVRDRVAFSASDDFGSLFWQHPMGNGLGGGGSSMPYFLANSIQDRAFIENEFGRIMLETGWLGLALWLGFVVWVFTRQPGQAEPSWGKARRLSWVYTFLCNATAFIGIGLLVAVPSSLLLLVMMGWTAAGGPAAGGPAEEAADRAEATVPDVFPHPATLANAHSGLKENSFA